MIVEISKKAGRFECGKWRDICELLHIYLFLSLSVTFSMWLENGIVSIQGFVGIVVSADSGIEVNVVRRDNSATFGFIVLLKLWT